MKLSIVIPTKNEAKELPSTFRTLEEQTFQDFEVIVADANSRDKTREIAKKNGARVVPGGLPGVGRNAGVEHAHGDIILFLDADVVLPSKTFLAKAVHEFEERNLDVATTDIEAMSKHRIDHAFFFVYNQYAHLTEKIRPHAPGFCILVKRSVHEAIKGFDESVVFAEDHEYVQRADRKKYQFGILRDVPPIPTSVRRFEKSGHWFIATRYLWVEIRMLIKGPFREKMPFKYDMGGE